MVTAGLTVPVPEAATAPTPWSMLTVVAFVVVQVKAADCPVITDEGEAVRATVGREGGVIPDNGQVIPLISGCVVVSVQGATAPAMASPYLVQF